jgi:hypothetical protein
MKYLIPTYTGDFAKFDKAAFAKQVNEAKRQNQTAYEAAISLHNNILTLARNLYGDKSKQVKYLEREKPESPPNVERKSWQSVMRKYEIWLEKERQREKNRDYRRRRAETNEVLQEHGYIPNEHYRETSAITFAKEVLIERDGEILPIRALPEPKGK